jgi:hypothetical protein
MSHTFYIQQDPLDLLLKKRVLNVKPQVIHTPKVLDIELRAGLLLSIDHNHIHRGYGFNSKMLKKVRLFQETAIRTAPPKSQFL